jgi:hypothetical protein
MTAFCNKHIGLRSIPELIARKNKINGGVHSGPGLRAELVRIDMELDRRAVEAKAIKEQIAAEDRAALMGMAGHKINLR